jgi:arsenate reductase
LVHGVDLLRNPAVTLARSFTNTFAGIRSADAPGFMAVQFAGALPRRSYSAGSCRRSPGRLQTWSFHIRRRTKSPLADKKKVLIRCTGNSTRSQMAEGLLRHDAGDRFEVESAGTKPGQVRPEAIAVMKEIGIDIAGHRSKSVDEFAGQDFDYLLTVCDNAQESCPVHPAMRTGSIMRSGTRPRPEGRTRSGSRRSGMCAISFAIICAAFRQKYPDVNEELRVGRARPVRDLRSILQAFRR